MFNIIMILYHRWLWDDIDLGYWPNRRAVIKVQHHDIFKYIPPTGPTHITIHATSSSTTDSAAVIRQKLSTHLPVVIPYLIKSATHSCFALLLKKVWISFSLFELRACLSASFSIISFYSAWLVYNPSFVNIHYNCKNKYLRCNVNHESCYWLTHKLLRCLSLSLGRSTCWEIGDSWTNWLDKLISNFRPLESMWLLHWLSVLPKERVLAW